MRFDRIRLHNFKCYGDADLSLDSGVTVIHGLNGSGKSSLLEACFFALYGSKALAETLDEVVTIGTDEMSVELWFTHAGDAYHIERQVRVTDGNARTSKCVLEGPGGTREGATAVREQVEGMLRMDTEAFVNCAYVRQGEVNKLINASPAERQDMLDDLLQLGMLEEYRERASDARVGVGRVRDDKQGALAELDDQIAEKEAKNLHDRRNECQSRLKAVGADIERFEENRESAREARDRAESILEEYEQKREELESVESDVEQLRERIQKTATERDRLRERIDACREELTEKRERRDELLAELTAVDESTDVAGDAASRAVTELADTDADQGSDIDVDEGDDLDRESITTKIESVREEIDRITERIRELSVEKQGYDSEVKALREQADELDREAEEKRAEAAQLETDIEETRGLLDARREKLSELREETEARREAFDDAPVEFGEAESYRSEVAEELATCRERRTECQTTLETERERLAEAEALLEAGKCPECGQPVEESPHVDAIGQRRERVADLETTLDEVTERETELEGKLETAEQLVEHETEVKRLESERENLSQLLDERETTIGEKEARIDQLREASAEHETEAETRREQASETETNAKACQKQIGECNREKAALTGRVDQLEQLSDALGEIARLEEERERLREQRAEKERMNDERRERLAEKRDRRDELQDSFDADRVQQAREKKDEAIEYLDQVTEKLDELEEQRGTLQGERGALDNEIEELEALRARRDRLAETVEHLDSLYGEAERLQEMYGTLRAELRQQNVETLERMLNETFELLYENDTYARIGLDGEYRLTVYQKDGETLDPEQLSGGERAIFNLSLRCAIYRLLAEGIEGAAPMPPLILDEPTVFLDEGHVSQLLELIGAMYDLGVDQILVVSHDNELVAAADDLLTVHKDSTTNRSSVVRGSMEELVAAADD